MESYITSIHINQLKYAIQHYWLQVYSCLFWLASSLFIHDWSIKERQLEMMMTNEKYSSLFTPTTITASTKTIIEEEEDDIEEEEEEDDDDCFSDEEQDQDDSETDFSDDEDDETIVAPWSMKSNSSEEVKTLHSFDTSKSEYKSNKSKVIFHQIKNQMTAWKQKHFNSSELKLFKKKQSRILTTTFRRKTSPEISL